MVEEKIYNIPLREAFKKNRIDRTNYAVKLVEDYLRTHTKKDAIKIGKHLNSLLWSRGSKKPPRAVRVKAVIEKDLVKAEVLGKEYEEFVATKVKKKEKLLDQLKSRMGAKALEKAEEEKAVEEGKPVDEVKQEAAKEQIKEAIKEKAEKEFAPKAVKKASEEK